MIRQVLKARIIPWLFIGIVVALMIGRWFWGSYLGDPLAPPANLYDGRYRVEKIEDAVTLIVREDVEGAGAFRVRLAGISLPSEMDQRRSDQATELTRKFIEVESGQETGVGHRAGDPIVYLQFDRIFRDEDQRALAYLLRGDEVLNIELTKQGLALCDSVQGNSPAMNRRIKAAQAFAENRKLGIHNGITN